MIGIREIDIEKFFVSQCRKMDLRCEKLAITGKRGFPDRTVFLPNGRLLFVEFKREGGRLSPQQQWWLEYLRAGGHWCYEVWSRDQAVELLDLIRGL